MSSDEADTTTAGERVFYRDAGEFNQRLDRAADSIHKAEGPDVVGGVIWGGLVAFQAFLYVADWIFDWEVREKIIPGVDLTKPLWVLIIGLALFHHAWRHSQHARILKNRLCLQCGTKLLDLEPDEGGGGACPRCGREFNVGEYRRPDENRGRGFKGYIDADHFDKAMYAAAEHLKKARLFGFEGELIGWCWLALGVSFGCKLLLDWDLFAWLPWPMPYGLWLVALSVWSGIYAWRLQRMRPAIVNHRLCLNCGYSLLHAPTDEQAIGRCPECGCDFATAQYERPGGRG